MKNFALERFHIQSLSLGSDILVSKFACKWVNLCCYSQGSLDHRVIEVELPEGHGGVCVQVESTADP
jgi:hypothetical protein